MSEEFCAGMKRERRLKEATGDDDDDDGDEDDEADNPEAQSSDPMMGYRFNECRCLCF